MTEDVVSTYEALSSSYDNPGNPLILVEEMVVASLLRGLEMDTVLDAATGTGRSAVQLAAQGKSVIGTDISGGMLLEASRKAVNLGLSIPFVRSGLSVLPFCDGAFDLVLCSLALAHVPELGPPFLEFARVVREGGHVIASDVHPDIQAGWGPGQTAEVEGKEMAFPAYHGSVEEYTSCVRAAGLELIAAIDVPMYQTVRGFAATGALVVFARKPQQRHNGLKQSEARP